MQKIYVQRKIEVWVEDSYTVDEITDESIQAAIDYDLDADNTEVLWESQEDLGLVEVYDQHYEQIYSNIKNE